LGPRIPLRALSTDYFAALIGDLTLWVLLYALDGTAPIPPRNQFRVVDVDIGAGGEVDHVVSIVVFASARNNVATSGRDIEASHRASIGNKRRQTSASLLLGKHENPIVAHDGRQPQ